MPNERVIGCDMALNHSAVVLLVDGKLKDYAYYTINAEAAKRSPRGTRLFKPNGKHRDIQYDQLQRLDFCEEWFRGILKRMKPTHAALEDYSLGTARGGHYTGELGGIVRMLLWKSDISFRLHDPMSLKMYCAHNGHAEKEEMEEAVKTRWKIDFTKLNPPAKPGKMMNREVSQDMADAFALAQLCLTELKLRLGNLQINSLHEKEIQVFNRVTKMYPQSILSREWIKRKV